jgi:hypothetical protein
MAGRVYDNIFRMDGVSIAAGAGGTSRGVIASRLSGGRRGSVASVGKDENCSSGTAPRFLKSSNVLSLVLCKCFVLVAWLTRTADKCEEV